MSVFNLISFSEFMLREVLVQHAGRQIRYQSMNYQGSAIIGPASLVINLHLTLLTVDFQLPDFHLPIGPK